MERKHNPSLKELRTYVREAYGIWKKGKKKDFNNLSKDPQPIELESLKKKMGEEMEDLERVKSVIDSLIEELQTDLGKL